MSSKPREAPTASMDAYPDAKGRYGIYGGRFVPETLVPALDRLQSGVDRFLQQRGISGRIHPRTEDLGGPADGAHLCSRR